jgi:ubiquinone biosynthesis protein COQ4
MDSYAPVSNQDAAETPDFGAPSFFDLPLFHPDREPMQRDFPKAWRHFKELIKDKENTKEVFPIFEALPWPGLKDAAERFLTSDKGRAITLSEPFLPPILDDHAALRQTPKGSLAHAYCDFMEREGLTAQGLVDEFDEFAKDRPRYDDQFIWYLNRLRDTHDLLHILTGYGRDGLGEQCVLAFTYGQTPALAHLFLGYAGALEIKKRIKSDAPVLRAVREGQRLGRACPRIAEMPIRELLAMQLEDVRHKLNITPASRYQQAHAAWRTIGVDPYNLLAVEMKQAA